MARRNHSINFWADELFITELRDLKRQKSAKDKKDYSDGAITFMIAQHPLFKELKKQLLLDEQIQIKFQMDKRRIQW